MKKLLLTLLTLSSGLAYTAPARKPVRKVAPVVAPVVAVAPVAPVVAPAPIDPFAQMLADLTKALSSGNLLQTRLDNIKNHIKNANTTITNALDSATPENKKHMLKIIEALRVEAVAIKAKYSEQLGVLAYIPTYQSTEIKNVNKLLNILDELEDKVTGTTLGKIAKRYAMKPVNFALSNKVATIVTLLVLNRMRIAFPSALPSIASNLGKAGKMGLWLACGYNANATTQPATAEVNAQ